MEAKTDYQLSTSVNEGIVEIVVTGEITRNRIDRLHNEVITIVKGKGARAVLCDVHALKGPPDNLAEVYFRARSIPPDVRTLPSAVVLLSEDKAYQSFYETTSANAGHAIKFFTDVNAARTWLSSKF